jgi:hypothetical protein
VYILVIMVAGLALGLLGSVRKARRRAAAWRAYAARAGLSFAEKGDSGEPEITGRRARVGPARRVRVWCETRGGPKNPSTYLFASREHGLALPRGLDLTHLHVRSWLPTGSKVDGLEWFDLTRGLEPRHALAERTAITEPLVRKLQAFLVAHPQTRITEDLVVIEHQDPDATPEQLDALLDVLERGARSLAEANRFDPASAAPHRARPRRLRRPPAPAARPQAAIGADLGAPAVEQLVADLASAGTAVDPGVFSIDRTTARARLRDQALAEPEGYLLALVQALLARGASRVDVTADRDDLEVRGDGRPFSVRELEDVWPAGLATAPEADARACQRLAVGLAALAGMRPRRVDVRSLGPAGGARLELRPDGEDRVERLLAGAGPEGTTITVRLGRLDSLRDQNARATALLRERAGHAPVPVRLNGERVYDALQPAEMYGRVSWEADGVRAVAGFRPELAGTTRLRLQSDGIWIEELGIQQGTPGLIVVVESERFRLDASHRQIVRDAAREEVEDLVTVLESDALRAVADVLRERPGDDPVIAAWLRSLLRYRLTTYDDPAALRPGGEAHPLASAPLLPTRQGGYVSLVDLLARRDANEPVWFADALTTADLASGTDPCLDLERLAQPADRALLAHLLGGALRRLG